MIEVSINHLEGLNFIADVKIVEPREKENGVFIERIEGNLAKKSPEFISIIKAFGMRKVGRSVVTDTDVYTFYPWGYFQYRLVHFWFRIYWEAIRWLYNNARMFKAIPQGEMFSWSYFTPYIWIKSLLTIIKKQLTKN